jgi:tRNA-2-methylthio-N6-dimethylallyladenosine synthase
MQLVTRRYHIKTFGCQMNEHDSERIAGMLEADGMEAVDDIAQADVVVMNTCCIRENADNRFYGHLGELKAQKAANPDLQIAVAGCLAQKDRESIVERAGHVDVVFGTHNLHRASDLLKEARASGGTIVEILEEQEHDEFPSALPTRRESSFAAWVTIQIGCDNSCAFCIVPQVRGREISRRMGDIVAEVGELARDGVSEITLLGQNVNSYGRDLGAGQYSPRFADLLRAVNDVPGIRRVRYTSPHPKDLRLATIEAMAECENVCEHLHLPLQSGSDRILARMHRGYTAERYLERLTAAREAMPELAVTTDIIVGFPGETEADFQQTLEVAAEGDFDGAYTFVYSSRPGTEAAAWVDEMLPASVTGERMERLVSIIRASSARRHAAYVGSTQELLIEGPSKRDPDRLTGRTRSHKVVHLDGRDGLLAGSYVRSTITKAFSHYLEAQIDEVLSIPAATRVRIPLSVV